MILKDHVTLRMEEWCWKFSFAIIEINKHLKYIQIILFHNINFLLYFNQKIEIIPNVWPVVYL